MSSQKAIEFANRAQERARKDLELAEGAFARARHSQMLAEKRSANAAARIAEEIAEAPAPPPIFSAASVNDQRKEELLKREKELVDLDVKKPYFKKTQTYLRARIRTLKRMIAQDEEEDPERTDSENEEKEEPSGSETESDTEVEQEEEKKDAPATTTINIHELLLPETRMRALIKSIACNSAPPLPEFNTTKPLKMTKTFTISFNEQLHTWVQSIVSTISFTSQSDKRKKTGVSCKTKTVGEKVIRDAIEIARPAMLKKLSKHIKIFADDETLLVVKTRLRNVMKEAADRHRIAADALELLRKALFIRATEVLLILMRQMHKEHRVEFDVCPPF